MNNNLKGKQFTDQTDSKDRHIKFKIKQAFNQYIKIPGGRASINPTILRSFGDWIYKHLHLYVLQLLSIINNIFEP